MKLTIEVSSHNPKKKMFLTKGDKSLDPSDLFGMWKENPRSIDEIRQQAFSI